MAKPITPSDVAKRKTVTMPDAAIEAFNELIEENATRGRATFEQDAVVERMVAKGLKRVEIFERGWLHVEDVFGRAGWRVEYDKPGWDETYPARFTFTSSQR